MIKRILLAVLLLGAFVALGIPARATELQQAGTQPTAAPLPPLLPDLTIALSAHQTGTCLSIQQGLIATVRNNGDGPAGPFVVEVNGARQSVNGLSSSQETWLLFPGKISAPSSSVVDADNQVLESNEANNRVSMIIATPTPFPCMITPTPTSGTPTRTVTPTTTSCAYIPPPGSTATPAVMGGVLPVTSPTSKLTQEIVVQGVGTGDFTVTLESGTFTGTANGTGRVTVALLPNTTHHLTVRVPVWVYTCGGRALMLRTLTYDIYGRPLTIVHQEATPTPVPTCQVRYSIQSQWQDGFVADVTVKNLGAPVSGWTLGWVFAGNQRISNMWSAQPTQSGASVSARNADWNATIATGGQVNFGFQASYSGSNAKPSIFTLNGVACETIQ